MTSDGGTLWQTIKFGREAVEVQARPGTQQTDGQPFVLLHDVQDIFPGASRFQCGKRALGFMVDVDGNKLLPLRVPHLPETALEVVVNEDPTPARSSLNSSAHTSIIRTPPASIIRTPSTDGLSSASNTNTKERPTRSTRPARPARQTTASPRSSRQRLLQQQQQEQEVAEKQLVEQAQQQQLIEQARQRQLTEQAQQQQLIEQTQLRQLTEQAQQKQQYYHTQELESGRLIKPPIPQIPPPIPASEIPATVTPRKPRRQNSNVSLSSEETQTKYRKSVVLYQSFLQHIRAGQTEQANVVKEDFRMHFNNLEVEMARNQDLQTRMLEMQETMLEMQQCSLDRLAVIQNRVQAILVQSYELHEYPNPRLFVVLPKDPTKWDSNNPIRNRFRLYFLCECGEHTKSSHQSKISHNIHLAKHEGYDLERPTEFFRRYGHYVLKLLQMFKYGVAVSGFAVPAMVPLRGGTGNKGGFLENVGHRNKHASVDNYNHNNLEPSVHLAIEFLQGLLSQDPAAASGMPHPDDVIEALEGSDLRRIGAFLKNRDEDLVLGNLYRIVTNDGYVKWVCQDHYRETCNTMSKRELEDLTNLNNGVFDEQHGRVEISLFSPLLASQFYKVLERARFVQELAIKLKWELTYNDAKALRDVIQRTNISVLELTCTASNSAAELLNRNKRAEPLWQIISNPKLRSFSLSGYSGLFRRSTVEARPNELRTFKVSEAIDWKRDSVKVVELLQMSPQLSDLTVGCTNIIEAYKALRESASKRCQLSRLTLEAGPDDRLSAQFEQDQAL
ncbi:hypothetical protein BGZ65_003076, partial [Modicella reniformis]